MLKTVKELYKDMFTSRGVNRIDESFLLRQIKTKRIRICDEEIREEEIDKRDLKNLRPITMLNMDLSNGFIKQSQKSTTQNHSYHTGVCSRREGHCRYRMHCERYGNIGYMNEKGKRGFLINPDLEKAFDRVEYTFMQTFKKLVLGRALEDG